MDDLILISGAGGLVGTPLIDFLSRKECRLRALTRKPSRPSNAPAGMEWVQCDLTADRIPLEVFDGVRKAFLLAPAETGDPYPVLSRLIETAKARGVREIVMMTAMGPDDGISASFRQAEALLRDSGIPHEILRPNWFMQMYATLWAEEIRSTGAFRLPAADARVSYIDVRDIAECAGELLLAEGAQGRTHSLTGGESLHLGEVAASLSRASGRAIKYVKVEPADYAAALAREGVPQELIDLLLALFEDIRGGYLEPVSGDVEEILSRRPRSFENFAEEQKAVWKGT
ncbi:MAG: SDR family oxidoreductase [Candidatus Sumerlaeia bacterium]|nr:SDR family oxidoreductase [Candidatus Sumerlaeia bacterium]